MKIVELSAEEQTGLDRLRYDSGLKRVLDLLNAQFGGAEHEARVVGGAVRNALMGLHPGDMDLATTADPAQVMERAQQHGLKAIATGIQHGTVTLVDEDRAFEVTTLREDVETDGRHAVVRFGRDWTRDAERRDFTFNAISMDHEGALHDPIGGLSDVRDRIVRFIGDPETRVREDYLRILRFFRFHARFGEGAPDADVMRMIAAQADGLTRISAERIGKEVRGLLEADTPLISLDAMQSIGLDQTVFGFPLHCGALSRALKAEETIVDQLGSRAAAQWKRGIAMVRLAALLPSDMPFDGGTDLRTRLRLSNEEQERLTSGLKAIPDIRDAKDEMSRRVALYRFGCTTFLDAVMLLHAAGSLMAEDELLAVASDARDWDRPEFPVKGATLMAFGHEAGPELGALINRLEQAWIASDFTLSEPELLSIGDMEILSF